MSQPLRRTSSESSLNKQDQSDRSAQTVTVALGAVRGVQQVVKASDSDGKGGRAKPAPRPRSASDGSAKPVRLTKPATRPAAPRTGKRPSKAPPVPPRPKRQSDVPASTSKVMTRQDRQKVTVSNPFEKKKTFDAPTMSPVGGVIGLSPPESLLKDGEGDKPYEEFGDSWNGWETTSKSWDVTSGKDDKKDDEASDSDSTQEASESEGNELDDEHSESDEHEVEESEHDEDHDGETGEGESEEGESEEGEGEEVVPGAWGSDPELRKALEILAFSTERREEDVESGLAKVSEGKHEGHVGVSGRSGQTVTSKSGRNTVSATVHAQGMAGAQAAAKTLLVASPHEWTAAVQAFARAGVFGSAGMGFDLKRGKAALSGTTTARGGLGAQAKGSATAHVDRNGVMSSLVAVFEFAAQAGASADIMSSISARYGKNVLTVTSALAGFAGVAGEMKGAAFANLIEGVGASGQIGAKAGAWGKAEVSVSLARLGIGEVELTAGAKGLAGAEAKAKGKAAIGLTGVAVEARASAFAGARAAVYGKGEIKLRGREVLKVSGKVGVAAGVGAEVGGKFEISKGKLVIEGELAAALGLGHDIGAKVELDTAALAFAILGLVADQVNKAEMKIDQKGVDYARELIDDPAQAAKVRKDAYEAVIGSFDDYAREVLADVKGGKLKSKTQTLDREHIQKLIQKKAAELPRQYRETDQGIEQAAQDAFGELLNYIVVDALRVNGLGSISPTAATAMASQHAELEKARKANNKLRAALAKYADDKRASGEHGVKQANVQRIVTDHWDAMREGFPGAQAAIQVRRIIFDVLRGFLGVDGGEVNCVVDDAGKVRFTASAADLDKQAEQEKQDYTDRSAEKAFDDALAQMSSTLSSYRAKLIAKQNSRPDDKVVSNAVKKAAAMAPKHLDSLTVDQKLKSAITDSLTDLLDAKRVVLIGAGSVLTLDWNADALGKAREDKAEGKLQDKHAAVLTELRETAVRKRNTLLKSGAVGQVFARKFLEGTKKPLSKAVDKLATLHELEKLGEHSPEVADVLNSVAAPLLQVKVKWETATIDGDIAKDEVFAEEARKLSAKIKGGQEQDNDRRKLVADVLRKDLQLYRFLLDEELREKTDGVRAQIFEQWTRPGGAAQRDRLQKIIDVRVKKVRADLEGDAADVADDAVVDTVANTFGLPDTKGGPKRNAPRPYFLKKFNVDKLHITDDFEAVPIADLAKARTRHRDRATRHEAEHQVQDTIAKDIAGDKVFAQWIKRGYVDERFKDKVNEITKRIADEAIRAALSSGTKIENGPATDEMLSTAAHMGLNQALGRIGWVCSDVKVSALIVRSVTVIPRVEVTETLASARSELESDLRAYLRGRQQKKASVEKSQLQGLCNAFRKKVASIAPNPDGMATEIMQQVLSEVLGGKIAVHIQGGKIRKWGPAQ